MFHNMRGARFSGGEFTNVGGDLHTTTIHNYQPSDPAVLKETGKLLVDFDTLTMID